MGGSRTIEDTARAVLAEVSPGELDYLPVSGKLLFDDGRDGQRARRTALEAGKSDNPTGFGGADAGMVAAFVLTVLSGVATDVLAGQLTEGVGRLRSRWQAWRQRRAIAKAPAREGLATPLPVLTAIQAARIGRQVIELAAAAGVSAEQAQRVATLLAAALTEH
jgi:hypothetical protein